MAIPIQFTIDGDNVQPSTVDISEIADIFKAIHSAIAPEGKRGKTKVTATLKEIRKGSVTLELEAADSKIANEYKRLIHAIREDDPTGLSRSAKRSAIKLSDKARTRNWSFALKNGTGETALISPQRPLFLSDYIRGSTSLIARIIRVGGDDKRTASLQLADGQKVTAIVASEEVTRQLGETLYQTIELHCEARWLNRDGSILWLKITGIGNYFRNTCNPVRALAELSELSEGGWDKIDPGTFIHDIRSSEE